jgi:Abnormal spindle-like microcephaly-assoc'd, ASPM-SPD-2-Hydin
VNGTEAALKTIGQAKNTNQKNEGLRKQFEQVNGKALILLASVLPLLFSGCGAVNAGNKSTSTSTSTSTNSSQVSFQITPATVSFGNVPVGQATSQKVTIANTSSSTLNITQVTASNPQFVVPTTATPLAVPSGQSGNLMISVNPSAAGNLNGTLTVQGNQGTSPVMVSLSAMGIESQPQIQVGTKSLDFGSVAVGEQGAASLTITNGGAANLIVSMLTVSGAGFSVNGITTPATIPAGQSVSLTLGFKPAAAGSQTGTIAIASNDPNTPSTSVSLTGKGTAAAVGQIVISPASYNFGSVVDGQSKSGSFTVTNAGTATVTIAQVTVNGVAFKESGLQGPAALSAGQSTSFIAQFVPATAGTLSGAVSISYSGTSTPATASLSGTGVAATESISAAPSNVTFGNVNVGANSTQSITLTNTGNSSLTISNISVSGQDIQTTGVTTPMTLIAGQKTALGLTFSPRASENVSGNVTVTTAEGSTTSISVGGSGVQGALTMTPSSVNFGSVTVGSNGSQTIRLTNSGTAAVTISQVSVAGSAFADSGVSLPISLAAGQSNSFTVQYSPKSAGATSGSISIVSNAAQGTSTIALSGTGIASTQTLSLSASSLSFGSVNDGSSSSKSVTVTNTGNANVSISQISLSGSAFSLSAAGTPVTLSPSQTVTFGVGFNPTSAGNASGSVSVVSNATNSPGTIALSGTGVAPVSHSVVLNWNASTSTVVGYNVYRSTTSGSGYTLINSGLIAALTYQDNNVQSGATYYYVATAVDASGNESTDSNQSTAVIP